MSWKRIVRWMPRRAIRLALFAAGLFAGAVTTTITVFTIQAVLRHPDLEAWHLTKLEAEFDADDESVSDLAAYRELEERLFAELRDRILDDPAASDEFVLGRYHPESDAAQLALATPYNRTWELPPRAGIEPRGGALLVHGLSDSPYSCRAMAEILSEQGFHVVCLRLPGHGTIPGALRTVVWEDWRAAVRLAARHVEQLAGQDGKLLLGGYSTGGALTLLHSLECVESGGMRVPDQLVLVAPAIGVSRFAVLTNVIASLAFVPGLEKADWTDVYPEYNPFKYNSFPVNAANQIWQLTRQLEAASARVSAAGRFGDLPRVLTFSSVVDDTVSTNDLVQRLYRRLQPREGAADELVAFDVNRYSGWDAILDPGLREAGPRLLAARKLAFQLTVISSEGSSTLEVDEHRLRPGADAFERVALELAWPPGVMSLGHLALPFPIDDPVFGLEPRPLEGRVYGYGHIAVRGEPGAFRVPLQTLARIRCNPFFEVIRRKLVEAASVGDGPR